MQAAGEVIFAAGEGLVVGISRKCEGGYASARYGRSVSGAWEAVDLRRDGRGWNSGEEAAHEAVCAAFVCDLSQGVSTAVVLVCVQAQGSAHYELHAVGDQSEQVQSHRAPLVAFTVRGSGPGALFEDGYDSPWVTDGPVVCVPKAGSLAVAQLAHRGGGLGFCWAVHEVEIRANLCRLLTVGCLVGDCSLPLAVAVVREDSAQAWVWRAAMLSSPTPLHVEGPKLPQELAGVATCALLMPSKDNAVAVGTRMSEVVVLTSQGHVAFVVRLSLSPRSLTFADALAGLGPVLIVQSVDSPPKLQWVPLRTRAAVSCSALSAHGAALPVSLSGAAHAAVVVPAGGQAAGNALEGSVCVLLKDELCDDEEREAGAQPSMHGLAKVHAALELKSLGCIEELQLLQRQLREKKEIREHTHSLLLSASVPDKTLQHTHKKPQLEDTPFMVHFRGHPCPSPARRDIAHIPRLCDVKHRYAGRRLLVEGTVVNKCTQRIHAVSLCIVANGLACESRGGGTVSINPGESAVVHGCARVMEEAGPTRAISVWVFECLLRWRLDGEDQVTWGARVHVPPRERLVEGSQAKSAELSVCCEADLLIRAEKEGAAETLAGVPTAMASLLGAHESASGVWVRERDPWLQVTCVGGEREARLSLRAVDQASLSLAIDTLVSGAPHGFAVRAVQGGVKREAAAVEEALDALVQELDFGAEVSQGGVGDDAAVKWLKLQAQTDRMLALLLQG